MAVFVLRRMNSIAKHSGCTLEFAVVESYLGGGKYPRIKNRVPAYQAPNLTTLLGTRTERKARRVPFYVHNEGARQLILYGRIGHGSKYRLAPVGISAS